MTLGSFFDGIGGWQLAARKAGVTPLWSSEIERFPAAVTATHFPDTLQLGDITTINADELVSVDIVCAGSPCQDLSVAGKRAGLNGARSGLFMDAIRIVRRLRERTGKPRYFVWENVPGAFSSNRGLDFRTVLAEISQTEIPMPQNNKWAPAGVVEWDGGSLAWRTLDAQYWGVPQRRKRIFLVADFAGQSAGQILFEPEGLHGHIAESEGAGKDTATDAGKGVDSTGGKPAVWDVRISSSGTQNWRAHCYPATRSRALDTGEPNPDSNHGGLAIYDMSHADEVMRKVGGGKANCLNSRMGTGGNQVQVVYTIDRHAVCVGNGQMHQMKLSNKAGALNTMHDQQCLMYSGGSENLVAQKTIRRLTPLECERLQGLQDGYTDIEVNGKPAPDSKRYKALGNGMAQPCADYVIMRIVNVGGIDE